MEQTKILSKIQEIVNERLFRDFTTESVPAMGKRVFTNEDEYLLPLQIVAQEKQMHKTKKIEYSDEGKLYNRVLPYYTIQCILIYPGLLSWHA